MFVDFKSNGSLANWRSFPTVSQSTTEHEQILKYIILTYRSIFTPSPKKDEIYEPQTMLFHYLCAYWSILKGTNVDEAKVLFGYAGLKILPISDLEEAARLAVKLSKIMEISKTANINVQIGPSPNQLIKDLTS